MRYLNAASCGPFKLLEITGDNVESLTQKRFFRNRRIYEIRNNQLVISQKSLGKKSEETFDLFDIDQNFDHYLSRPYKWIFFILIFLAPATFFLFDAIKTKDYSILVSVAFFAVPIAFCLYSFFHNTSNLLIFRNRHTGQAAFVVWNNNPSESELKNFVAELQKKIQSIFINPKSSVEEKLQILGKYLEVFLYEEILSESEAKDIYERSKKKLGANRNATVLSIAE